MCSGAGQLQNRASRKLRCLKPPRPQTMQLPTKVNGWPSSDIPVRFIKSQTTRSLGLPDPSTCITWELSREALLRHSGLPYSWVLGVPTRSQLRIPLHRSLRCHQPWFLRENLSLTWNSPSRMGWPEAPRGLSTVSMSPALALSACTPPPAFYRGSRVQALVSTL